MSLPAGERIRGIGAPLPPGEQIRWEGRPRGRALARRAFHARAVLAYGLTLGLLRALVAAAQGDPMPIVIGSIVPFLVLGVITSGISRFLGWLSARTTVYAITDRRLVLKVGMVVPSTINIPFRMIDRVQSRLYPDGTGDFAIGLGGEDRLAYFQLWPHARPWRFSRPEPMLRAVPDAAAVAQALREALTEFSAETREGVAAASASRPQPAAPSAPPERHPVPVGA